MGNESNSNSNSDSDDNKGSKSKSDSDGKKGSKSKSDSDDKKDPSIKDKIEAVVEGMGEGYFESQDKEDQQYQKEAAEYIGTAIGKKIYSWFK